MAARTPGFSLYISDICYTLPYNFLISFSHAARLINCARFERVAHPVEE